MSRQIKFRTWDKNRQSFIGPVNLLGDQKYVILPENWPWENYCEAVNLSTSTKTLEEAIKQRNEYARENWILQQWTGLLDKNGAEIYEGDIVEWGAKGPTEVRWISEIDGWDWTGWHPCYTYGAKIIGNIFQNPELLAN